MSGSSSELPLAFLGPEGTFTAEAATRVAAEVSRLPLPTIAEVFEAVRCGKAVMGVVPLENLLEGSVNATLDELAFGRTGVFIRGEVLVEVEMHLLGHPETPLSSIRQVVSHPHALAQCRGWLARNLPDAEVLAATSTAEAARLVSEDERDDTIAAIGTTAAARRFDLAILAAGLHDHPGNMTRFGVLGSRMHARTGTDKTSLVVFFGEDRPGLLLHVLDEFALRGINLTKIESRPTKTTMGEYCILIDCDGHPSEPRMAEALRSVHRHVAEVKLLGAYPRADTAATWVRPVDSEEAYGEAGRWYERLIGHMDA